MKHPKSAYEKVGGMFYFARMLDKIRMQAVGELHPDFHANLGLRRGGDGFCCTFLRVAYEDVRIRTHQGGTDEEIFRWCCEQGRKPEAFDLMLFNEFLRKFGWNDLATPYIAKLKEAHGLSGRDDIVTMMDFFDADEGREA